MNYSESKKYTDEQKVEANNVFKNLYDEFFDLRIDKSGKHVLSKNLELMKISFKLELLYDIENRIILLMNLPGEHLKEFRENRRRQIMQHFKEIYPKVNLTPFLELEEILKIVQQVIKSQTNIFDEKSGSKDKKIEKEEKSIQYIVLMMSKNLDLMINVNELSCLDFIEHEKLISDLNKKQ